VTTFNLPDLGEGLPEAEIVAWLVKEGDRVQVDQPMLSVETAKAVVEVPSPYTGVIEKLHAKPGDTVQTGKPLVDFQLDDAHPHPTLPRNAGEGAEENSRSSPLPRSAGGAEGNSGSSPLPCRTGEGQGGGAGQSAAQGMVVGRMTVSDTEYVDRAIVGRTRRNARERVRAAPAVRMLAKKLGVDLAACRATGRHGLVSMDDVLAVANRLPSPEAEGSAKRVVEGAEKLRGTRKAMAHSMSQSRDEIAMCTIFDDADLEAWRDRSDITIRLIRAIVAGVAAEPALNALYDPAGPGRKLMQQLHLAIAVDTADGLIVPVIRDAGAQSAQQLRATLNSLKERTRDRTISPGEMRDYTFTLSNFGTLAGRYATPLVTPPTVAILGAGKLQRDVVAGAQAPEIHTRLPLSLTFDHRCITGGEACRFLAAVIADLQKPE
jgi:pyruvate dehydrogenase E2 component (dihydrolipoamide acetyltransferase)